jgi:hypothetical protein
VETKQQTETTGNYLITGGLMNGVQAIPLKQLVAGGDVTGLAGERAKELQTPLAFGPALSDCSHLIQLAFVLVH